jgi:negative regulator of flagellin synthesis FlgM
VKIDDSLTGLSAIRNRTTRKTKDGAVDTATSTTTAGDSVAITSKSAQLSKLEEELRLVDSSDTAKIEAIKLAIAEGRFEVDEEAVADALVQNTMEQLRRQGKK